MPINFTLILLVPYIKVFLSRASYKQAIADYGLSKSWYIIARFDRIIAQSGC